MPEVNYWLSFEVSTSRSAAKGADEAKRQSIYDAVTEMDAGYWAETTSFVLFTADDDIDAVGRAVTADLDPALDRIVLRKVDHSNARYWGKVEQPVSLRGYVKNIAPLRA